MKKGKLKRKKAICKKCGCKFSYKQIYQGQEKNYCPDCTPKFYAQ